MGLDVGGDKALRSAIVLDVCRSTTAIMLSPSRIAALLVLRIRPAAPSDGTYLVEKLLEILYSPTAIVNVPISFICECTSRVARGHLLGRQKSIITISLGKETMKQEPLT